MKIVKGRGDTAQVQPSSEQGTGCMVHGCPLPGTLWFDSTSWQCCVHDGTVPQEWASVTSEIRGRARLFEALMRLRKNDAFAWDNGGRDKVAEWMKSEGRPDLCPGMSRHREGKQEGVGEYVARLQAALIRECRGIVRSEREAA